jgi:hypothetical protein
MYIYIYTVIYIDIDIYRYRLLIYLDIIVGFRGIPFWDNTQRPQFLSLDLSCTLYSFAVPFGPYQDLHPTDKGTLKSILREWWRDDWNCIAPTSTMFHGKYVETLIPNVPSVRRQFVMWVISLNWDRGSPQHLAIRTESNYTCSIAKLIKKGPLWNSGWASTSWAYSIMLVWSLHGSE